MKPITLEWVEKAEGDWISSGREFRARKSPNYDSACFHAQQCAEKYLKARLAEAAVEVSKTHNLQALLEDILETEPMWEVLQPHLQSLNAYSVAFRYPGNSATRSDAKDALKACAAVRNFIRQRLGLPD